MSINTILSTATTGLMAAQTGLRTVSDNVANANTPGYVRKIVDQSSLVSMGAGAGVSIDGIRRVVDRYLGAASVTASSTAGRAGVLSEMLDRAQGLFGDPSGANSFFSGIDAAFTQFAALANDPSSSLQRGQVISELQSFFDDASRISASLTSLRDQADMRIDGDLNRVNDLLAEVAKLNADIRKAKVGGADGSGAENIQSQLIDELSTLINVQSSASPSGGVVLRTAEGALLADVNSGTVTYNRSTTAAGYLTLAPADGQGLTFDVAFRGGEVAGLLEARNREIPGALTQLAGFMEGAAREINRAHNASSAVPAPASLTGKATGLDGLAAFDNFQGVTTIALMDSAGVIQNRLTLTFNGAGGSIQLNSGAAVTYAPQDFAAGLDTQLGGLGDASFVNGVLSISATTGGLAVVDHATTPSSKAGVGFSQFFGLNDLIDSSTFSPNTGLAGADAHGFTGAITLRLSQESGARVRDVTVTPPVGGDMNALVAQLNAVGSGVRPEGQFALDANGRLGFSSLSSPPVSVTVTDDQTVRGGIVGGPSMSALFGLGTAGKASAAAGYSVRTSINENPSLLAAAQVNLTPAVPGTSSLAAGDGRGALALAKANEVITGFSAANGLPASQMTLSRYASEFAGSLGRKAASADTAKASAEAVKLEADNRRSSYEGVNVEEELVRLTQYQQAFAASARLVQAANDLYDVLLAMV